MDAKTAFGIVKQKFPDFKPNQCDRYGSTFVFKDDKDPDNQIAIDSDSSEPYYFDISPDNLLTLMLSVESGDYEKHLAFEESV